MICICFLFVLIAFREEIANPFYKICPQKLQKKMCLQLYEDFRRNCIYKQKIYENSFRGALKAIIKEEDEYAAKIIFDSSKHFKNGCTIDTTMILKVSNYRTVLSLISY